MTGVRKYRGSFNWEGVKAEGYPSEGAKGVSLRWLVGPADRARNFALRYFELEPGGYTPLDSHVHDHGVMVLRGRGWVLLGSEELEVSFGDTIYIPPKEIHRFRNAGDEPFGFLCVIGRLKR